MCPDSLTLTKEMIEIVELSRGAALVIDYGEDHAFTNSFRVKIEFFKLLLLGY